MTFPPPPEQPDDPNAPRGSGDEQEPPPAPQPPQAPPAPQYAPQYPQPPQYAAPQAPQYAPPQYAAPQGFGIPGPGEPFNGASHPDDLSRPLYGASFGQAVKRFFKNYANFTGRASRSEYWWVALFQALVLILPMIVYIIGLVTVFASTASYGSNYNSYGSYDPNPLMPPGSSIGFGIAIFALILMIVFQLGVLVPQLAITWRRLHDANLAGPLYFLSFVPYAGSIVVFIFTLLPPKPQGRRFDRV